MPEPLGAIPNCREAVRGRPCSCTPKTWSMDMTDDDPTGQLPPEEPEGGGPGEPATPKNEGEAGGDEQAAPAPGAPEEPTHELPPAAEEPTREQPSPAAAPGPRRLKR